MPYRSILGDRLFWVLTQALVARQSFLGLVWGVNPLQPPDDLHTQNNTRVFLHRSRPLRGLKPNALLSYIALELNRFYNSELGLPGSLIFSCPSILPLAKFSTFDVKTRYQA
jgi:hypothetical protein